MQATSPATQPSRHAMLAPSSAYKWKACAGSIAMERLGGYKDSAGKDAKAGTFMHHVAAFCLEEGSDADMYLGYKETVEGLDFEFTDEMAELVQVYLDTVRSYLTENAVLYVEQSVDISWITGEAGAIGTADAIIVRGDEIIVVDLKTGRNDVDARQNDQLTIYAAAAIAALKKGKLTNPVNLPWIDGSVASENIQPDALQDAGGDDLV